MIIYLGAFKAVHPGFDIVYQDINGLRDLPGDMLEVDLSPYDFILASPPCNFWSRAVSSNRLSNYSISTKHLLPGIINRLAVLGRPFVVENVRNKKRFIKAGIFDLVKKYNLFVYYIGRHTYFSNVFLFDYEISYLNSLQISDNISYTCSSNRQGGFNVHIVFDYFLHKFVNGNIIL